MNPQLKPYIHELARRLCVADVEVHQSRIGRKPPCPEHLEAARRYWGLVSTESGRRDLSVLVGYAEEVE